MAGTKSPQISEDDVQKHRILATQVDALYVEINKLATKKPADRLTPLISRKINHVIARVKDQVKDDEFLDAIETIPVEGENVRLDEALIILGELRSIMDRQWNSPSFVKPRQELHLNYSQDQIMR